MIGETGQKTEPHRTRVLQHERFGNHVLLRYRWEGEPPLPGQFVTVRPSASAQALDPFLPRPFFAHDYEGGAVSLLFEVRGRGTALLAEGPGSLLVGGPRGRGFVTQGEGPLLLLGGGVWVAPLKLLSRDLSARGIRHDVYLEMPRSAPDAYKAWISEGYPGARLVPTEDPEGAPGRILDEVGDLGRYAAVYASGPRKTLEAVVKAAKGGVPAQLALRERMACANGSCYGCTVPVLRDGETAYARACVEGPVFPAEDLAW